MSWADHKSKSNDFSDFQNFQFKHDNTGSQTTKNTKSIFDNFSDIPFDQTTTSKPTLEKSHSHPQKEILVHNDVHDLKLKKMKSAYANFNEVESDESPDLHVRKPLSTHHNTQSDGKKKEPYSDSHMAPLGWQ